MTTDRVTTASGGRRPVDLRFDATGDHRPHLFVAAVALLLRRYTGEVAPTVVVEDGARTVRVSLDLRADGGARDLLTGVGTSLLAAPAQGADAGTTSGGPVIQVGRSGGSVSCRVSAGPLLTEMLGPAGDPDGHLLACLHADLAALIGELAANGAACTADLLAGSAYERVPTADTGTAVARPTGDTIPAAFAAQVARHPDRAAVLADDGRLTYRQLAEAARGVAVALRAVPGGPARDRVGVLCRHGAATVTAILGALLAGHAYVPLDPAFPRDRLVEILRDSEAFAIVTDRLHAALTAEVVGDGNVSVLVLEDRPSAGVSGDAPAGPAEPDDPAYLLYTSGSTGTPKGVVQTHRNVLFGVRNHARNFRLTPVDRLSVLTSFGFDMAVTDTFSALLSGAAAVPVDVRSGGLTHLTEAIAGRGVTVYHSTPTVYRHLVSALGESRLPTVRAVLLGGEEVSWRDIADCRSRFGDGCVFVNGYGTTEVSFIAQDHIGPDRPLTPVPAAGDRVPVGRPLPGIDVVLAGEAGRTTCLEGEVVVCSPHVALGYWRRPELTAERFVSRRGVRGYRTGDLARRLPDGRLVYLGRVDRQVKVRGFRVEPAEIEARLATRPGVRRATVAARRSAAGEVELVGFVEAVDGAHLDPAELRRALAEELPAFLVPGMLVPLREPPLTATGKLDVHALLDSLGGRRAGPAAAPDPNGRDDTVEGGGDDEMSALTELIGAAWREVLGLPRVGLHDRFFEIGGHSLTLALVHRRLEGALARRIPLAWLFQYPTVASLARRLGGREAGDSTALDRAARRMAARSAQLRRAAHGDAR